VNTVIQTDTVPETATRCQLDPEQRTHQQAVADHLGPAFGIIPIGYRRFRCNRFARPSGLFPTGRLTETLLLRVTSTGIEQLSDLEPRSDRARRWKYCRVASETLSGRISLTNSDRVARPGH
jgi:hypothetical protein